MGTLAKRTGGAPSLSSQTPTPENQFDGVAGENIDSGDACYLAGDGFVYRCTGNGASDETALVHGFSANSPRKGRPMTIYRNAYFGYTNESAQIAGKRFYVDATTAGAISDTVNGKACAVGALNGNIIVTTTWDKV